MKLSCALAAAAFVAPPIAAVRAEMSAAGPALAAHRAVYDLSLLKGAGAKAPAQAGGRIAFDFSGSSCDGYVQNFRQLTELQPAEGAAKTSDMRSATFEGGDGSDYRFKIETKVDNMVADTVDGKAQKLNDSGVGVDLAKPKRAHLEFGGPTLFPTEHLRRIILAARAGESLLEARVYDGTGNGDKAFESLTVIGKPVGTPATEKAAQADGLKGMTRWPVAISYFEAGKKDGQPIYVISFDVYENGVSRALKLDYGDFVLKGEMKELTLFPTPPCKK